MKNCSGITRWARAVRLAALLVVAGWPAAYAQITDVGGIARDFTITNRLTRQPLRLSDYQGTIILLDFFAWWCGPCRAASPDVETNIYRYYQARGGNRYGVPVTVISVNIESESPENTDSYVQSYGLSLVADDLMMLAYSQFDLGGIPLFVVINGATNSPNYRQWEVVYRYAGYSRSAITNAIEQVSVSSVPVAPTITSHPASRTIIAGGSVSFAVRATGLPAPEYKWYFNNTPLAGQGETYAIANVGINHAGQYKACASNSAGMVTSQVAQLTVLTNSTNPGGLDTRFALAYGQSEWTEDEDFVRSLVIQPDGKILASGFFFAYLDGQTRNAITRLNPNGTVDTTFNPGSGANGGIYSVALQSDGKVLAGGYYSSFDVYTRNRITRLATNGAVDTAFNPGVTGNGAIYSLLVQPDGRIIVGGSFTNIASTERPRIARLLSNGSIDTIFNPGTGPNNTVLCLARQPDGKILVGGYFSSFNGVACNGLVRLNSNGTVDTSFNAAFTYFYVVNTILLQSDGKIVPGGWFYTRPQSTSRYGIARFNANGALDTSFDPGTGANDYVRAIQLQPDGKLIVGGNFTSFNGTPCERLVRLNANGSVDSTFGANLQIRNFDTDYASAIWALALQSNDEFIVGGLFREINGYPRSGMARLHGDAGGRPLFRGLLRQTGGRFDFSLAAQPGKTYAVQASTDLQNWGDWLVHLCTNGVMSYNDEQLPNQTRRYFRVVER